MMPGADPLGPRTRHHSGGTAASPITAGSGPLPHLAELASEKIITREIVPAYGHLLVVYETDRDRERRDRDAAKREAEALAELARVAKG